MPKKNHQVRKVLNLPSVKLPIKPLTSKQLDQDIKGRLHKINQEFTGGFDFIKDNVKSVTFFGSARFKEDDPYYQKAVRLGERLADLGYAVVTGGGPGVMAGANQGAWKRNGKSLGLTIRLDKEQVRNPYVTDFFEFYYFFTRKVCLTFSAEAFVYFPGGFGTLDEVFEILTLVQTNKIQKVPVILVGKKFWLPFDQFIKKTLYQQFKAIDQEDLKLYQITDDEERIIEIIKKAPIIYN